MAKAKNRIFINPTKGKISSTKMVEAIADFVEEEPDSLYRLIIGTDSQARRKNGKAEIDYVTAVVAHRIGRGARYYWRKEKKNKIPVLRDKIYTETLMSLDVAQEIVPCLREAISPTKYDFEIHIDVGPLGPTRDMIKEVVGMVNGSGFEAKTKPESWGASSVADKHA
ncbi:ribonuclease H-like YkuK family protein [Patescibacteria group bacterium]|nr:ribonuclease H-like YkuK family protein [Patescibacteria group bacterium]MBU0776909.1 ribonuclease H-like YkuK family protein [Patescibacteria group bacterium]MBU0846296.1 ribonuclease H-like YkuK family protein [Patescibacteria group bacterium]MBU0922560.1 ribonuclease H-like YkuK family protein [Patescibacteria group bacterium]MBU1066550.1 ribonuclease H-like YkuK family protein [Patescibacteria group bacterium]